METLNPHCGNCQQYLEKNGKFTIKRGRCRESASPFYRLLVDNTDVCNYHKYKDEKNE